MTPGALVTLDRSGQIWVGTFPTLGMVRVHADGTIEVEAEPDEQPEPEDLARREAALVHGWGEPLSLVRRGHHIIVGTAMVPPTEPTEPAGPAELTEPAGCLVLRGPVHDVAMVMTQLAAVGWTMLANRVVPVRWDGTGLVAHPRSAPTVVSKSRARKAGLDAVRLRADTDAVSVEVARCASPVTVAASVSVTMRRPDDPVLKVVEGHERFQAATSLVARGVLWPAVEELAPPEVMRRHLQLSALPTAELTVADESLADDAAELERWWAGLGDAAAAGASGETGETGAQP